MGIVLECLIRQEIQDWLFVREAVKLPDGFNQAVVDFGPVDNAGVVEGVKPSLAIDADAKVGETFEVISRLCPVDAEVTSQ